MYQRVSSLDSPSGVGDNKSFVSQHMEGFHISGSCQPEEWSFGNHMVESQYPGAGVGFRANWWLCSTLLFSGDPIELLTQHSPKSGFGSVALLLGLRFRDGE